MKNLRPEMWNLIKTTVAPIFSLFRLANLNPLPVYNGCTSDFKQVQSGRQRAGGDFSTEIACR
jgi:hypothetical protein